MSTKKVAWADARSKLRARVLHNLLPPRLALEAKRRAAHVANLINFRLVLRVRGLR